MVFASTYPLTSQDLDRVDRVGSSLNTIGFDDSKVVTINRKVVGRFTRHGEETETISFPLFNSGDCQIDLRASDESTFTVDQGGIRHCKTGDFLDGRMIPNMNKW
jgi:hypothetical protein